MFVVRKFRWHLPLPQLFAFAFLLLSIFATGQDQDKDKEQDKGKESKKAQASASASYVKVEGKVRCVKADPTYSIDVPDRPGHSLMIAKRKCAWTEPLVFMGAKSQDGEAVSFTERMEGTLHVHGFETDTMDNGEKLTWQSMGQVLAEKGPATAKGRWSLMRGTGKLKGIKGGGTYEGKLEADDTVTLEFEGVFDPTEMAGEKK